MEDDTASAAAANTNGPPPMTTVPPSSQRGHKRGRRAEEDGDEAAVAGAARGWPRRPVAGADALLEINTAWPFATEDKVEAVTRCSSSLDFLDALQDDGTGANIGWDQDPVDAAAPGMGEVMAALSRSAAPEASALEEDGVVCPVCGCDTTYLFPLLPPSCIHYDAEFVVHAAAADPSHGPASPKDDAIVDGFLAMAGGDTSAEFAGGSAPDTYSSGPFGFDLNQLLSSNVSDDEGFPVVPENAVIVDGSAVGTGIVLEFAADGATARPSPRGFDFDLNQPCPAEFPDDEPADPSDLFDPAPAPAEGSLAAPEAGEPPDLPDGGAPVSPTRRRHSLSTRLWDWAFKWTLAWP